MKEDRPSTEYVKMICSLYGGVYDDRVEDSKPGGRDWIPGVSSEHKSLSAFRKELAEKGIELSISKIQKILVSGGCWTTARSREVQALYSKYIRSMDSKTAVKKIAKELEISIVSVNVNLPYGKVVYGLENRSGNARRVERSRRKKAVGLE